THRISPALLSMFISMTSVTYMFFLSCYRPHPHLHSFPTRRSSDLTMKYRFMSGRRSPTWWRWPGGRDGSRPGGRPPSRALQASRSEEHTSELQSLAYLVCRLLLEKKKTTMN